MPRNNQSTASADVKVASVTDERLDMFDHVSVVTNFESSVVRTFRPLNVAESRKEIILSDPFRFLDTSSLVMIIRGKIMNELTDGSHEEMPAAQLSSMTRRMEHWAEDGTVTVGGTDEPKYAFKNVTIEQSVPNGNNATPMSLFPYALFKGKSSSLVSSRLSLFSIHKLYHHRSRLMFTLFRHPLQLQRSVDGGQRQRDVLLPDAAAAHDHRAERRRHGEVRRRVLRS